MTKKEVGKILGEYVKTIKIPKTKPNKQVIICPIGVVGAGKTTVVKSLSDKIALVRVSTDEIRKILKDHGYGYDQVKELAFELIKKYIKNGYSIVIDADCVSEASQKHIKKLEDKYGVKPIWIHVNPPEEFIINKLKNFKHTWLFKNSKQAIENYKQRKLLHRNLKFPFIYEFDTSKRNLNKQIEKASKIIKDIAS